ncbi:MAG: hypothetical protein M0R80_03725 [Proteobacteria bacterium]|jgi:hypothetical protein|nr:hypothetical protein [Pseudomonadota bacterium]
MKEFIQFWNFNNAPKELKELISEGDYISYIPRDYPKDMRLDLRDYTNILIKSDLKRYNGILVITRTEPKFQLQNVVFNDP